MKVAYIKELLSQYSDNDDLMVAWNDRTQFEYVLEGELPIEIWQGAVKYLIEPTYKTLMMSATLSWW